MGISIGRAPRHDATHRVMTWCSNDDMARAKNQTFLSFLSPWLVRLVLKTSVRPFELAQLLIQNIKPSLVSKLEKENQLLQAQLAIYQELAGMAFVPAYHALAQSLLIARSKVNSLTTAQDALNAEAGMLSSFPALCSRPITVSSYNPSSTPTSSSQFAITRDKVTRHDLILPCWSHW